MKIESGLFDHMAVQRNRKNVSEAGFSGTCNSTGAVIVTVRKGSKAMKGFSGVKVGTASKGCINGLPTRLLFRFPLHGLKVFNTAFASLIKPLSGFC